jgi:hypothetical protein
MSRSLLACFVCGAIWGSTVQRENQHWKKLGQTLSQESSQDGAKMRLFKKGFRRSRRKRVNPLAQDFAPRLSSGYTL